MTEPFKWPEGLSRQIWAGDYWGPNGALAVGGPLLKERIAGGDDHALSPLSSLYYSAAGNAGARWRKNLLAVWWAWRAEQLLTRAEDASDQLEAKVGLSGMNPDELDVRQTILRKARRFADAERCINEALSRESVQTHTRGLLFVGRAECHLKRKAYRPAFTDVSEALDLALDVEKQNPKQASRIYKGCAHILQKIGKHHPFALSTARSARAYAEMAARKSGAKDQLLKMGAK